jgi:hypothetical protein
MMLNLTPNELREINDEFVKNLVLQMLTFDTTK